MSLNNLEAIKVRASSFLSATSATSSSSSYAAEDDDAIKVIVIDIFVRYMPLWIIICLGIYAVYSIAMRVINMADNPDAITTLTREMDVAKKRLIEGGYEF